MVKHTECPKAQRSLEMKFARSELQTLESLRRAAQHEIALAQLKESSGIEDDAFIQQLYRAGFTAQNLYALEWLPIAMVAWASDGVTANEIQAARLTTLYAQASGRTEAAELVGQWLKQKPPESHWELWSQFVYGRQSKTDPEDFRLSGQLVLAIAERVARASGGFLGIQPVSSAEREVLLRIRYAYGLDEC